MLGYITRLSKFRRTESDQASSLKSMQEENREIHEDVEIKQHSPEQPMGQKKLKRKLKSMLRQTKMEIQHTKTSGMQQKPF